MRTRRRRLRGGNTLTQIERGNANLIALRKLAMAKPPLQRLGQIVNGLQGSGTKRRRMCGKGPAYVDKYGVPIHHISK